jgi:hypothetical protein
VVLRLGDDDRPLVVVWREEAAVLRRRGATEQAEVLESCADELERAVKLYETEELSLPEASRETGYTYAALQRMMSEGRLPNAGEPGKPRVRRADLPRKPGRGPTLRLAEEGKPVKKRRSR